MSRVARIGLLTLLLLGPVVGVRAAGAAESSAARRAVCVVCAVRHGESEPEPVRATRMMAGREYTFCSTACAAAFDAEPTAFTGAGETPSLAPAFDLVSLSGASLASDSLRGRVVLLDFWATWCAPCRKGIPALQGLHERYASQGLVVIGASTDEGGPERVRRFVSSRRMTYPVALDSGATPAWQAFEVKSIPTLFLIGRDGRLLARWNGLPKSHDEVEQRVRAALSAD
jgi:thiol-disulfide isomerase/thioredoxin